MARKTKKQIAAEAQQEREARAAAVRKETDMFLAANEAKVAELADLFRVTMMDCINWVYDFYNIKTKDRFGLYLHVDSGVGLIIEDACSATRNSIRLNVGVTLARWRTQVMQCNINHSTNGNCSIDDLFEFSKALQDMVALGRGLQGMIAPVAAVFQQERDGNMDARTLFEAADRAWPSVCDYAKLKRDQSLL